MFKIPIVITNNRQPPFGIIFSAHVLFGPACVRGSEISSSVFRFDHRYLHKHNPVYNRCYQEIHTFPCTTGIRWDGYRHQGCTHNLNTSSLAYNHLLLNQRTEVRFQKTDASRDFFYPHPFRSVPALRHPGTKVPSTFERF